MGAESPKAASTPIGAVFLSYASQDAEAAQRICAALRAAGIEVWLDQSELRGGDAWDRKIHDQIRHCALFIPIISAHSQARLEGYFRREWKFAVERKRDIADELAFLLPVVIDETPERGASVPEGFHEVQWTRLPGGAASQEFIHHVSRLLNGHADRPQPAVQALQPSPAPAAARPASESKSRSHSRMWLLLTAVAIVVIVGYIVIDRSVLHKRTALSAASSAHANADKSIAVLPFADMSEKHDQEYFADGMAEEILDILAKIPQLTVIGRTSSFQFKGRTGDLRSIGEKLGAAYVVEGSVRKAGNRIRVTAQLIDSQSGAHLWSDSFDRGYGDVLTLQDEIATAIARALQLTVDAHDARPLRDEHATEAYTLYLRGKLALDIFSGDSLLEAQNAFQQALQLDPTLLPAAEGLAQTYVNRGFIEADITSRDAWEQARSAARKALQISPRSGIGHSVLGVVAGMQDFDWATAQQESRTALALSPNDPDVLLNAAQVAMTHGDREEGLRQTNASLVLDPLNSGTHQIRGYILYVMGDYAAAEQALRKSIAITPQINSSYLILGSIQLLRGQLEAASKDFAAESDSGSRDAGLALVSHAFGRKAASDAALAHLVDSTNNGNIWPYGVAWVYAYRGEHDQAFEWLEKSRDARGGGNLFMLGDPFLKPLHDDPRWSALMKSMNLQNVRF
jgi:TolB-like protein/Flp pilus assembly protein TadD